MFRNLVNPADFVRLVEKVRSAGLRRVAALASPSQETRVKAAWEATDLPPIYWHVLPSVRSRTRLRISGDPDVGAAEYVASRYLQGSGLRGLSVACGTGRKEVRWAETGRFACIDAYDISAPAIASAREYAKETGLADTLNFQIADVQKLELEDATYDVVIAESALHHLTPLRPVIERLRRAIRPGGYLVVSDFVGPPRFQWTDRQVEFAEGVLAILPERYRRRWTNGRIKRRIYRPGRLTMRIADPSEAAESDRILPILETFLEVVEQKALGGTIAHLVLHDIAHNFEPEDDESRRYLNLIFENEDAGIESNELGSDFVFGVYRKMP
jgi:SAM-dependent methyltransferase